MKRRKKINFHLYLLLLIIVFGTSCSDRFCHRFINAVKSHCNESENKCYITLDSVFNFGWDSLYIFDSGLYPDEVSKRMGIDCKCKIVPEGKRLIVFTKGNKIVEKHLSRCFEVNFVEPKSEIGDGVVVVDPKTSFLLEKRLVNNEISYYLFKR